MDEKQAAIDGKIRWIGLDGRQGTFEQLVDYELEQRVLATNPGTTLGSLTATAATVAGGTTEQIRAAGEVGNAVQSVAGGAAGFDPRAAGPKPGAPETPGRRRPMPSGPGLGRRSQAVGARSPATVRAAASSPATATATPTATATATVARQPTSVADKHILNGEVATVRGRPVATGFILRRCQS